MSERIRALDPRGDRAAIEANDTGFETDSAFELVRRPRGLELVETALGGVRTKRYDVGEVFASWKRWQRGWVAVDDGVRGFATVQYEPWHERLVLSDASLSEAQSEAIAAVPADSDTPEESLARAREVDTVRGVIAALPEPFRETLILREMEDMSYREIASVTGVPIGTVMSRLARAREMLAKVLLPTRAAAQQERQA